MVLSCFPVKNDGSAKIDVYVDGFAQGEYPPNKIESIRILTRFGEDIYEFFPDQAKELTLENNILRIHMFQPLSAGQTAEMRFEGKIAAEKGREFSMRFSIRNERRSGEGDVRCTIE